MILEYVIPVSLGLLFLILEQLSDSSSEQGLLSESRHQNLGLGVDQPRTLDEALELAQRGRMNLIKIIGNTLPLEVSLSIFERSGFAVASEWSTAHPANEKDFQQAAFKYLEKMSHHRNRSLSTIARALDLAERYVERIEDPVDKADACATLFLAAGSRRLGSRVLSFVHGQMGLQTQAVDPLKICSSLVHRANLPATFLDFSGDVLCDIKIKTPTLLKIGLYRIAYPLIALSEPKFGYALYSSLFNEVIYYMVAAKASGDPDFMPEGRAKAMDCRKFIMSARGGIFEEYLKRKLVEIGDVLILVWYDRDRGNAGLYGDDKKEDWIEINGIVKYACGSPIRESSVANLLERISGSQSETSSGDYLYTLLSTSCKCGQQYTLSKLIRNWGSEHPFIDQSLTKLRSDLNGLFIDDGIDCTGFSPAYSQALLDMLKRAADPGRLAPLAAMLFAHGQNSATLTFLVHVLEKQNVEDCALEASKVLESLDGSPMSLFERLTVGQFNVMVRLAKVKPNLIHALSSRIFYEISGDMLDNEHVRAVFNDAVRLSRPASSLVLQVIASSSSLTSSPGIWRLVDRLPSLSDDIKSLYHQ